MNETVLTHARCSVISTDGSLLRSVYQGLRSLLDGANGTPILSSFAEPFFFEAKTSVATACFDRVKRPKSHLHDAS